MAGPKQLQNLEVSNRRLNSTNVPLEVALVDASGNQVVSFGGGTQYTEGDADATITGTALLFEGDSTNNTLTVPNSTKGLPVNIVAGSAAGTEYTDANSTISGPNQTFRDSSGAVRGVASTRGFPVAIVAGSAAGTEYTDANSTISGPNQTFRDSSGAVRGVASTRGYPVHIVAGSAAGTEYTDADSTIAGGAVMFKDSSGAVRGVTSTRALPVGGTLLTTMDGYLQGLSGALGSEGTPASGNGLHILGYDASGGGRNITVIDTAPPSTSFSMAVRQVGNTTVVGVVRSTNSVAADFLATVSGTVRSTNSVAADHLVTASQGGTWNIGTVSAVTAVSSLAGLVKIVGNNAADGPVNVGDSTLGALKVNVVAGSAGGTEYIDSDSTIAGPNLTYRDSSGAVRGVATTRALPVAQRALSVSADNVLAILATSSGGALTTNTDPGSTADAIVVRQVGWSTTHQVSSVGGIVAVRPSDTNWLSSAGAHFDSSGALVVAQGSTAWTVSAISTVQGRVMTAQNSTVWETQSKVQDSSGVTVNIVGTRPTTGAQGFAVRTVLNDLQSTCFSSIGNNSTSSTVVSSAANVRHKVFAFSITSTMNGGAANTLSFASSLANPIWTGVFRAISSGITGIQQAVTPPAWLFATEVHSPLVFKITGSTGTYHLSFSYFTEA